MPVVVSRFRSAEKTGKAACWYWPARWQRNLGGDVGGWQRATVCCVPKWDGSRDLKPRWVDAMGLVSLDDVELVLKRARPMAGKAPEGTFTVEVPDFGGTIE